MGDNAPEKFDVQRTHYTVKCCRTMSAFNS